MSSAQDRNNVIYVFYGGKVHSRWQFFPRLGDLGEEVYNGAYVWVARQQMPHSIWTPQGWYRADATPCLIEDVPKQLRALALLLI